MRDEWLGISGAAATAFLKFKRVLYISSKRVFDIISAIIGCIALLPIALIVKVSYMLTGDFNSIFLVQKRIGQYGKEFNFYKFRTMIVERYDKNGVEIMSEKRITKIGKILRKTSLDELPQLFNVLNGTMSIIGPRPMLDYQAPRCIGEENLRFEMRPGITGLAQVKGRNNIQWEERIQYDIEYVKTFTFWKDIAILFKTVYLVLKKQGTDVKPEYRTVSRFSKHYVPGEQDGTGLQQADLKKIQ